MTPEESRFKRLKIRSWRRGTKEMDLILGPFFEAEGSRLDSATLDAYEALLEENDQDLYRWYSRQDPEPEVHSDMLERIRTYNDSASIRT